MVIIHPDARTFRASCRESPFSVSRILAMVAMDLAGFGSGEADAGDGRIGASKYARTVQRRSQKKKTKKTIQRLSDEIKCGCVHGFQTEGTGERQ